MPKTAMDILAALMTGKARYAFTVRVYDPRDPVPKVPVRLHTYGCDA
jgi:hypothetical protein